MNIQYPTSLRMGKKKRFFTHPTVYFILDPRYYLRHELRGDDRFSFRMGKEKALYPSPCGASYGTHGQAQLDRATLPDKFSKFKSEVPVKLQIPNKLPHG
jgi:hypothetical protein